MLQTVEKERKNPNTLIQGLVNKAETHSIRNNTNNAVDWDLPISPPFWMSKKKYVRMVSNLIYGELATARACKTLQNRLKSNLNIEFLQTQIDDELHHAEIYSRYLAYLGHEMNPSPKWQSIIEECLNAKHSNIEMVIAFHFLLEGEAVFLQKLIAEYMPCPLFSDINHKIRTDEARHVAFGKIILPPLLNELSNDESAYLKTWAKELWFSSAHILVAEYLNPLAVKTSPVNKLLNKRWQKQEDTLTGLGLS